MPGTINLFKAPWTFKDLLVIGRHEEFTTVILINGHALKYFLSTYAYIHRIVLLFAVGSD